MKNIFIVLCLINSVLIAQNRIIVINECMPKNSNTASDQDGEFNDWVELYNTSNSAINLEGYFLSDRRSQPTKFKFPNVIVQSEDYLIIWLDTDSTQAGLHTNFKLSASSEQVYLFNPDTNLIDYVHFYNMQADQSIARTHDGNGPFKILSPTFDSSNGYHPSGLVINEWMPFNESLEEDEYGEYNDWIELYNNSNQSINLEGYFISNKANEATKYQFPNINVGPNEYLVLWADEDTLQGDLHLPFKLDSERDDIVLARPDTTTIDYFYHHNVDSNLTQVRIPNGTGNIGLGISTIGSVNEAFINVRDTDTPKFTIYPNPCNDFFNIEKVDNEVQYFELIDSKGTVVKTIYSKDLNTQVKLTGIESGLYILKSRQEYQNIVIH